MENKYFEQKGRQQSKMVENSPKNIQPEFFHDPR